MFNLILIGALGCVWSLFWFLIIRDTPAKDGAISKDERRYIQETIGFSTADKEPIPWKRLFTSVPVYAIVVAHFTENWGVYTLITQLPTFLTGSVWSTRECDSIFNSVRFVLYRDIGLYTANCRFLIGLTVFCDGLAIAISRLHGWLWRDKRIYYENTGTILYLVDLV